MSLDFNNAEQQRTGELIPDNEVVPVHLTVRPGGHGEGGWLKRSKAGDCLMLDCEFTVIEGPHAKRKFWTLMTVEGETDGQKTAVNISRSKLRAMLESARGINPADESEAAITARRTDGYGDFDGVRFVAVVGVDKGTEGYKDKNNLKAVVTPDRKNWAQLEQQKKKAAPAAVAGPCGKPAGGRPSWAA